LVSTSDGHRRRVVNSSDPLTTRNDFVKSLSGPQPTLRLRPISALLVAKEVHHGLFLLFASEMVTHELQLRTTRSLPGMPEVCEALQMRCASEAVWLYEGEAEGVTQG